VFSHVAFVSVPVDDLTRARDFYRDVMGMQVVQDDRGPYGRWVMMGMEGAETRIHLDRRGSGEGPPSKPVLVLVSRDIDADCERLAERGARILAEPSAAEWNPDQRRAVLRDSEGNAVLVTTP
jgi:predicted enzyme related to lactoylglutathione lyase